MRHGNKQKKLKRESGQRQALLRGLVKNLITRERIKTTGAKAKALRPVVERLVTLAKKDTVANRRLLASRLGSNNRELKTLCQKIAPRYSDRAGGYTRITKLPRRLSDGSTMSIIEFI